MGNKVVLDKPVLVLSDIHGNSHALSSVLNGISDDVDTLLFLGDLCGYYGEVEACVEMLSRFNIYGVLGNHDNVFLDCWRNDEMPTAAYTRRYGPALQETLAGKSADVAEFLQALQPKLAFCCHGQDIRIMHGSPWDLMNGRIYPDQIDLKAWQEVDKAIYFLGHTHHAMFRRVACSTIVNPGSMGQPRDVSRCASYALYDPVNKGITFKMTEYDPEALMKYCENYYSEWPYLAKVLAR